MTIDDADLRAAWLAELWGKCPEVPREVRAGWAAVAGIRNETLANDEGRESTDLPACA